MDGFGSREGEEADDDSPLTVAVSCLMSYEHTGECMILVSCSCLSVAHVVHTQTFGRQTRVAL